MKARQITLILAMLLIFSLVSPGAHAASEILVSNEGELLSAAASAANGDIIRLTNSITCTSTISVLSKLITFNLDGNNLNVITDSDIALDVRYGGVALLGSGEFNVSGRYCGVYAIISTVTVTNVTAREFGDVAGNAVRCSGGSVTVRRNVTHTGRYGRGVWTNYGGKVEVLGDVTVTANASVAIEAANEGTSVMVHGNCRAIGAPSFGGISVQGGASVTVNGAMSCTGYFVRVNMKQMTAAEGVRTEAPYEHYRSYFLPASSSTVIRILNQVPVAKSPIPTRIITAGTSAVVGGSDLATDADISETLTITEIVSAPDSAIATAVLLEGSMLISAAASGNTSVSVVVMDTFSAATTVIIPINVPAVCSIDEIRYPELADALTAAKDGDEIELLDNISTEHCRVSGKDITINLNGYTLNIGGTNAVEVEGGGELTILGAGLFTTAGTKYGIYVHDAGVFNYSGTGTFTLSGGERCVYADGEGSSISVPSVTQIESSGVGVYAGTGATINVAGNVRATGRYTTCVYAAGGTITVSGNILNTAEEGKAVRAAAGGRVTVNGSVSGSTSYGYGAYAESGGSITVGGPVFGYIAAYADGTGSSITALHSVISVNSIGAYTKNGAVISVGIDITGGEARAESGGKITIGRDIVSSGVYDSTGAKVTGRGSSIEVGRNVSASGGLVSRGAKVTDGGTVTIHGSITGAAGSMVSIGADATDGTITVDGTIQSSGIYIRVNSAEKAAANYALGSSPYENYMIYQNGAGIVRVKIPTVINNVTAAPPALPVSGGTVAVTVSGYSIPTGIMVAAFDESGAATGITGLTTGSVNVQTALLTFPANTVITEKTYTIKVSLNGGAAWNEATAAVAVEPLIKKAVPPVVNYPSAGAITYGQPLSGSLLTGGSGDGTFAWERPDTLPSVNNTGYTVIFTPNDVDNYDYTDVTLSQTVNLTVYKATPAVIFPTAGGITYGQSLAACILAGGSGDGIFAWVNPDEIPTVVNSDYLVRFTPNDTDNYITMTRTVAVSVRKADQAPLSITEPSVTYGDAPFYLSVSGGSGTGALCYSVTSGDAVAVGNTGMVTVLRPGMAIIRAVKTGDGDYLSQTTELRFSVNKGVQNKLTISGIPARVVTGRAPFRLIASGGSGSGALSYTVVSGNAVSVDENGIVTILKGGTSLLSVTKAEDEYYLATTATAEIEVRNAVEEAPSASPTPSESPAPTAAPSPVPTAVPSPTATAVPSPTATAVPSPTATATIRPSATDVSSSQDDSPVSVMIQPLSIQADQKTDGVIVTIRTEDLPEGAAAIKLPSGEIIQIDTTRNSLALSVSRRDINEAGELTIIALNEAHTPMGSYLIDLSDDAWQNGTFSEKTGFGSIFIWILAGVLVVGGAMTAMLIFLGKKK